MRDKLEAAWEDFAQTDPNFRRFACSIIDERGLANAGRFGRMLDAEAWLDAAMLLVPTECWVVCITEDRGHMDGGWFAKLAIKEPHKGLPAKHADTPAEALLSAILASKETDNG